MDTAFRNVTLGLVQGSNHANKINTLRILGTGPRIDLGAAGVAKTTSCRRVKLTPAAAPAQSIAGCAFPV